MATTDPTTDTACWTPQGDVYHTDPSCESVANPNTHDLRHGDPSYTDRRLCQHCRDRDHPPRIVQLERDDRHDDVREWLRERGVDEFAVRRGDPGSKTLHAADECGEPVCGYAKPVRWRCVECAVYPPGYYPTCTDCLRVLDARDGGDES